MTSLALLPSDPAPALVPPSSPGAMPSVPANAPPPPSTPPGDGRHAANAPDHLTTDHGQRTKDRSASNRANAQHSTGPRTPAGKARAAQNARTHGLTATTPPTDVPVPDPTAQLEYTVALVELRKEHRPSTPTQHALVNELALILWKLQYLPRIEHRLLNTPLDAPTPQPDPRHITPHPRLDHDLDPTARILAAHFASDHPTPLTRLFAYHNRLQARTHSILNQLRRLHRDQQQHEDDDDGTTWARAYNKRNTADHRALLEESRRIHEDNQRKAEAARQTPPTCSNAHQPAPPNEPAQNEPTSSPSSPCLSASVPSVLSPAPAQHGATRSHIAPQDPPPAQNEPTAAPPLSPCPAPAPTLSSPPGHPSPRGSTMSRTLTPLLLLLTCLAPQLRAADDPPPNGKTGTTTLTFTDRSPLSTNAEICNRMRWPLEAEKAAEVDYKLPEESFEVYVPADYTGEKPFGLLVFVNPHPSGRPPQQYLAAIDKHHLIYVGANNVGNNRFPRLRMGLSIDAAVNMKARYNIDKDRVYVSGISGGGRVSSMLGVGFPDLFKGGIYCIGCNFYKTLQSTEQKVPGTDKLGFFTRSYDPPPAEFFRAAREKSRHVLITGDFDENREQTWLYYQGFKRDHFDHVTYYQVPGMGHQAPPADWYDAALAYLDAPPESPAGQRPADAQKAARPTPPKSAPAASQPTDRAAIAASLLTRAKLYVDNHVYEQARERLKWITTQYPETPAAAEARKMLKEIEAGK